MVASEQLGNSHDSKLMNSKIRVELAVDLCKEDDLLKIKEALLTQGVGFMSSDFEGKTMQIEIDYEKNQEQSNISTLQRFIENKTGITTVVKGIGHISSAVTELSPPSTNVSSTNQPQVFGVLRLSQLANGSCLFDGALEGLNPSEREQGSQFKLAVHQFGDLSGVGFENIGDPLITVEQQTTCSNSMSIRKVVPKCNVASLIGKSAALAKVSNEQSSDKEVFLSAGVIARASTIASNRKQICSCSGKTIWEERIYIRTKEQNQNSH